MINETEYTSLYYYYMGATKVWTPNPDFARARAEHYGTDDNVYVEKYKIEKKNQNLGNTQ